MIVIDTSAIVAIFRQEPDAPLFALLIGQDEQPWISAANVLETSIVMRRWKDVSVEEAEQKLDAFINSAGVQVAPVTEEQTSVARRAHARYGKGGGHPAQLNFGDCFAYALAKALNAPLLFKGADFARTDIRSAI